jgi:hypothetical protein
MLFGRNARPGGRCRGDPDARARDRGRRLETPLTFDQPGAVPSLIEG